MVLNFWVFEKKVFHICSTRNRFYSFQNFVIRLEKKLCLLTWSGPLKQCIVHNYPCIFSYMKLETREGVSPMGEARPYVWLSRQWRKRLPPRQPVSLVPLAAPSSQCTVSLLAMSAHAFSPLPLAGSIQKVTPCVNIYKINPFA